MPYCIYLRKSRADTELERLGEGETLARHKRTLLSLAKSKSYAIGEIYEEIVSGETIAARPQMQRLLSDVEQGRWDGVLVMELERLARGDSIDQGIVAQTFRITGTLIITPNKVYNPLNEFDEEYFEFGLFMSRREYKTINRRLQAGRIASVKEGNYIGSAAPFGYNKVRLDNGKGFTLEENDESPYVKMIFDWYVNSGMTAGKIAEKLTLMGVTPKKGGSHFPTESVRDILRNRLYTGKITWNWRPVKKTVEHGMVKRSRPRNDESDMIIVDGLHPALISEELYEAAQERTGLNPRVAVSRELVNPFAHVMVCKGCGSAIIRKPSKKNPDYLICPNKYCGVSSAPFDIVEKQVLERLAEICGKLKLQSDKVNKSQDAPNTLQIDKIEKELTKLKDQQNKLYDLLEQGIYSQEIFLERQQVLNEKRSSMQKELVELRGRIPVPVDYTGIIASIEKLLSEYATLGAAEKNSLLCSCVRKITYYRDKSNRYDQKPVSMEIELKV